ncbi:hypothetical protein DFP72DRAFT_905814 [Ephemerocybe angulata]|uniref:Zinc-finger domain-containing protein n=1 Tax=Ephemerocybe angulata TaxID=980116 RepID=A0A8H6HTC0_9AGAR|nr:hypothetical protein DFP72DRAFT_905814 [Tulosesus angulatus]
MKRPPVLNALQREQAARSKPGVVVHDDLSLALNSAIRKNHDSSRAPKRKSQDDAAWEAPAVKKPRPVMQNRVEEREAPAAKKARPNIPSVKSQVDAAEGSRSAVKKPRPTIPPLPSRGTMPPPPPPLPLPKKSAPKKPRASKPPPPPWTYDKASDSLCLLSTNFFFSDLELWMNARHLLPAPQDKIDERALALPSRPDWNRGQPWGKDIEEGEDVDAELTVGEWWLPEYEDDYEELEELGRKGDGEGLGVESEDSVGEGAVAQERFGTPEIPLPKTKPPSVRVKSPVKVQQPGAAAIVAPSPSQNAQSHMVTSPHASPLLLPSLKALGKRREEPPGPRSPSRMNVGNGFINMLRPKPASPICSTLHPNSGLPMNIYRNPQSSEVLLASINTSPAASSGLRHIPVENQSPFYVDHNAAAVPPLVDDDLGTSSFSLTSEGAQWGAAPQEEYHFDTINPTLLQQPDEIMAYGFGDAGVQDDLGFLNLDGGDDELGYPDIELGYPEEPKKPENDIYMSDGEHGGGALGEEEERRLGGAVRVGAEEEEVPWSGSSSSSSFSGSSSDSSRAPTPVSEKKKVTKKVVLAGPSPTIRRPRPTPPSDIELLLGEMPVYKSDSDDADWNGSKGSPKLGRGKRKKRKTRNADEWVEYRHLADELVDEYVPPGEPLPTTSTKVGPPPTSARLRIGPPRGIKWKVGDEEGFCHQCRSKSTKLKMSCNGCTKLYCNRCISIRYVDLVFASAFSSTSPCPFCSSSCNCDACCRKRGETYISPSGIARAPDSAPKTRQLEPREPRALRQKQQKAVVVPSISRLPALPTIIRVPSGSNLEEFGPIYSLDGSKLKVVYSNEVESTEAAVVDSEPIRIEEPYKARRVFIGAIPKSWRLQQPKVVDLEPCEESAGLVGRKGGAAAKKVKMYVGKPIEPPPPVVAAPVPVGDGSEEEEEEEDGEISVGSEPPGKLDLSDFGLMFDSPLTSLPDSEVEGSVDEDDGKSFATHSLEDVDLARAISAGLAAIGVPVEHPSLPEP